jgi:hypothetical protein
MKKILISILGVLILVGGLAVDATGIDISGPTISGYVKDLAQNGIPGVTMSGLPENPTTGSDGHYSATVSSNWSGIVKPQKIGYAIFPFSTEYVTITSNQIQNYTAVLLPKVALSMQPGTYNLNGPINITMTLQNQGSDFFSVQGFMATNFALFLQFIDPDNKLITSNYGVGRTPPPPAVAHIETAPDKVELLPVDYVEKVLPGWVLSMPFNVRDFYTLTTAGNYTVKAKINMRAYLPSDVNETQTNPPSGIFYALHDLGSSGDAESNVVSFALSTQTNQTITVTTEPPTSAVYPSSFGVAATASSGLLVSIAASGACSGSGSAGSASINMTSGTGTCLITFDQPGNSNSTYNPAPQVTRWVSAQKANQTITFGPLVDKTLGSPPFTVSATASSGLAVSFSVLSGPATIFGNTVTITGVGTVTIRGSQDGNANWNPATPVDQSFSVTQAQKADQTITFAPLTNKFYGDPPFAVSATASSGLPVSFSVFSGPATISGTTVTITGVGTVTIRASQAGNANWNPAPNVDRSFQVLYAFTGFFSPVDNPPTVNAAKGGQAVPVKWRLTDANGVGISDPGSFAGLTSYQANCTQWGGITDPIPEEASGASGLQYLGSGNWQYNWKTSKGYAGTCRVMVLTLKDGSQHTADFKFK